MMGQHAMLHVGLTGNIATGKSCASLKFAELGAHVVDADRIARELLSPGTKTYRKIVESFGEGILCTDGAVDRRQLGEIIFRDSDKRLLLNRITHPEIGIEIRRRIHKLEEISSAGIIIVEAALLVETGAYDMYDRLIVVFCDPEQQIQRLMDRDDLTYEEAKFRIDSQMPIEEKLAVADYTIDTSGPVKQTHRRVEAVYGDLLIREIGTRGGSC